MKKIAVAFLFTMFALPIAAEELTPEAEIDLDSIRQNKANNTSEIRMKIYNDYYEEGGNEMYYATYYLKMDCLKKAYRPMIIEGYNKRDQLMLVDYEQRQYRPIVSGSNLEQAFNYACKANTIPQVEKKPKKKKSK